MTALKDYSTSPAPNFDAVCDLQQRLSPTLWTHWQKLVNDHSQRLRSPKEWRDLCDIANVVHPFQRQAWYDLHFGQGAWLKANAIDCVASMGDEL